MRQEKKAKHYKDVAYNIASSSIGEKIENSQVPPPVQPMVTTMHFPSNGYGSFNQGYPLFPNFRGTSIQTHHNAVPFYGHNMHYPFYHHNAQLPIYPQVPGYFPGVWNPPSNATSMNGLLQQLMNSGDKESGNEVKR
ncbi:hypothetical protein SESBI_50675 [Sesbania bispinosa]|nr:hypothetical protein SESBI_50675 [Sesbania bispinosa]